MNTRRIIAAVTLSIAFSFVACKKDAVPYGAVSVNMTNIADSNMLVLGQSYKDANGDSLTINLFNYYMSNIVLTNSAGKTFNEANSYHLVVQGTTTSYSYTIAKVPAGTYTSMTFLIGVDSAHDVNGAQTGALDPGNDMFWDWNTGYIMAKMEGVFPKTGTQTLQSFQYHIGGFSGQYSALRTVTLTFPQPITVSNTTTPAVNIHANALSWFRYPHLINIQTFPSTMAPNANSIQIADNYANMFGVDSVK